MKRRDKISLRSPVVAMLILATLLALPHLAGAAGTLAGTNIQNTATVTYQDTGGSNYNAISNTATTTVNAVYTVSVTQPVDQSGTSNSIVYYAYTVTNTGNDSNTFALSAASGAGGNTWTVTIYADDNQDGIHQPGETTVIATTGALAADANFRFFVAVSIPSGTANGQVDDTVLTVVGSGDAGAGDDASDTVTTTAQAPSLSIVKEVRNVTTAGVFGAAASANPGHVLEYKLIVANSSVVTATNVVLTDNDHANTSYVGGSVWIGSNGGAYNGAGNLNKTDAGAGDPVCASDQCGAVTVSLGNPLIAYLGNGATEAAGGSLSNGSTVYVYFRVTVD